MALYPHEALAADAGLPVARPGYGGVILAHNLQHRVLGDPPRTYTRRRCRSISYSSTDAAQATLSDEAEPTIGIVTITSQSSL